MARTALPLAVNDIAAFARVLRARMLENEQAPSHLELLNWLTRAAGYKNFQHFRAVSAPMTSPIQPVPAGCPQPQPVDETRLKRLARLYDGEGRLVRWPSKRGMQLTCLWTMWAAIPPRQVFDERTVTRLLDSRHHFGDPVLLRRELCDMGLLWRTPDCRAYRRIERRPPPDAVALIRRVGGRPAPSVKAANSLPASSARQDRPTRGDVSGHPGWLPSPSAS